MEPPKRLMIIITKVWEAETPHPPTNRRQQFVVTEEHKNKEKLNFDSKYCTDKEEEGKECHKLSSHK